MPLNRLNLYVLKDIFFYFVGCFSGNFYWKMVNLAVLGIFLFLFFGPS